MHSLLVHLGNKTYPCLTAMHLEFKGSCYSGFGSVALTRVVF